MGSIVLTNPVAGTEAQAGPIATNFTTLQTVINGNIDGANLYNGNIALGSSTTFTFGGDTNLYRASSDILITDDSFIVTGQLYPRSFIQSNNNAPGGYLFIANSPGDTFNRFTLQNTGDMNWGSGSLATDIHLSRSAAGTLKTDNGFWALDGLVTKVKAGIPTDSDLVAGMQQSGAFILDTTNSRIYFRVGTTWKYAALT